MENQETLIPILNLLGLSANILGAFILFVKSIPPSLARLRGDITFNDTAALTGDAAKKERRWTLFQKIGFLLIFLGFLLQLPGAFTTL